MAEPHDPYEVLRQSGFRRLLVCNILASISSELLHAAIGWDLYQRTGEAWHLGLVGLAQFLPVPLFALPAGHAADRYPRHLLYAAAQGLMTLTAVGFALLSLTQGPLLLIYGCLALVGVTRVVSAPCRASLVPLLVPPQLLTGAIAWNTSGWQLASVTGPALGGMVLWAAGPAAAYGTTAVGALICVGLLVTLRVAPRAKPGGAVTLASLFAGLAFLWRTKLLLAASTLDLFAVLLGGATALLPVFTKEILHVGEMGFGLLRAAPSVGALVMAFYLAHRPPLRRAGPALLLSVAGFGLATVVFGLSRNVVLSALALALTGALDNVSVVIRHTLVQRLTPDEMRGRVSAVNLIFISSSNELGAFESGAAARLIGAVPAVVAGGLGTVAVVLAAWLIWPQIRLLGSLEKLKPAA